MPNRMISLIALPRLLLVAVLALALGSSGFAHQDPTAQDQARAYVLAGGDWDDLCADGPLPHTGADTCMACLHAMGGDLPPASGVTRHQPIWQAASLAQQVTLQPWHPVPGTALVRAPPAV
jgi:hypothetical protein